MFFGLWTGLPAKNVFLHKETLLRIIISTYLLAAEVQRDVDRPKRPILCPPQPAAAVSV